MASVKFPFRPSFGCSANKYIQTDWGNPIRRAKPLRNAIMRKIDLPEVNLLWEFIDIPQNLTVDFLKTSWSITLIRAGGMWFMLPNWLLWNEKSCWTKQYSHMLTLMTFSTSSAYQIQNSIKPVIQLVMRNLKENHFPSTHMKIHHHHN